MGMISSYDLKRLNELIKSGNTDAFYTWTSWLRKRDEVLSLDNYECQECKRNGRYSKAVLVHHIKHLKDRPDLALTIWDGKDRQLISLCKSCHEKKHPESLKRYSAKTDGYMNAERWD